MKTSYKRLKIYLGISILVVVVVAVCFVVTLVSLINSDDTGKVNKNSNNSLLTSEISKPSSSETKSEVQVSKKESEEESETVSENTSYESSEISEVSEISENSNVPESSESSDVKSSEAESSVPDVQDEEFVNLVKASGYSVDKLNSSQLVIVQSDGTNASVYFYEKQDDIWKKALDTVSDAYVGSEGVSDNCSENYSRTPKGLYKLGFAFGCAEAPENIKMEYRLVEPDCYWIDDPSSENYNQWFQGNIGSTHAEELYSCSSSYKYAVLIQYNYGEECVAGKGSAFFLHCSANQPTAGCVAIPESSMYEVIKWLDDSKNPNILIF